MKKAQDRQKSYADVRRTDLQFQAGDKGFLKVPPSKGITRFGVKGKLKPHFIGPYEILEEVGPVAYQLALPPSLGNVHNVFSCVAIAEILVRPEARDSLRGSCHESGFELRGATQMILDRKVQFLRNKSIASVKVLWRNHEFEEATWELEDKMMELYPELFP
ncbi:uncharacterized protein LOC125206235 [Salvia hispanica]|uniref:uncharacterized protein LOC125206235 n=1 Tax=Salvia hispanica TaxID=49212 RepID=UPI002009B892|nr:uncharacterized protein LOC125206235 [Salvia hispanica]